MTIQDVALPFVGSVALVFLAAASLLHRMLARHEAALTRMRAELKLYDVVCRRGGDAEQIMIFHREGTSSRWVDIVLQIQGMTLRYPIRPDQVERFVSIVRGEDQEPMPDFLPDQ